MSDRLLQVPAGWTKGERLIIHSVAPDFGPLILMQHRDSLQAWKDGTVNASDIAFIRFHSLTALYRFIFWWYDGKGI